MLPLLEVAYRIRNLQNEDYATKPFGQKISANQFFENIFPLQIMNIQNTNFEKALIIVPVFNVELTIHATLSSIIHQNYINYEVVVSENHSTDRTSEILKEFAGLITVIRPGVHLVGEKHYNFCLDYARKRQDINYLAIYHGDDLYSSDIVRLQVAFLRRHQDVPAVFSDGLIIDQHNNVIGWVKSKRINPYSSKFTYEELLYGMISSTITCLTPTVMLRYNSIKDKLYQLEPEIFGKAADYGLWLKLAMNYGYLGIIHHEGIRYRKLGNNASTVLEKLPTESDGFKTISIYIGTDVDAQTKGWKWKAHIDRLKVQDYFRRINAINGNNIYKNTTPCLAMPKIGFGYYLISLSSLSGIYFLCIFFIAQFFRTGLFSIKFSEDVMSIILNSSTNNKFRGIRYLIMKRLVGK